jgi:hypothetical protein
MVPAGLPERWGLTDGDATRVALGAETLLVPESVGADALRDVPQAARAMVAVTRRRLMLL